MSNDNSNGERAPFYGTLAEGMQFYRRPGARLEEPERYTGMANPESGDTTLAHRAFHTFDKAHVAMLAENGIIPSNIAASTLHELNRLESDDVIALRQESGHYCHAGEALLIEALGEDVGGWIHVGRSTGDLQAVARRYELRHLLIELMDSCIDAMEALCDAAERFRDVVMPNYTLYQHAQVGTFGWYLIGWERPLERSYDRFSSLYDRVNRSPAGLAAGTTTDFPIDRERTAEFLGFEGLVDNAEDGIHADFDLTLEAIGAASNLSASIGFGVDHLLLWNTEEFDMVDLPDRFFGTSSILAQKRNPAALKRARGDVSTSVGRLMEAYMDAPHFGQSPSIPTATLQNVVTQTELWSEVVSNLSIDEACARERIYLDWALATDVAGAMVRHAEIPWRWAHQITSILVRKSVERERDIRDVTSEHIDSAARAYLGEPLELDQSVIDEVIDAERAIEARAGIQGSPAPSEVEKQIEKSREHIGQFRDEQQDRIDHLEEANVSLENAVDEITEQHS